MANTQHETGNAINVGNFNTLISYCTGFGTRYNPSNTALRVTNMQTLKQEAATALTAVNSKKVLYTTAVDDRAATFKMLTAYLSRIRSTMIACGASKAVLEDLRSIVNKIRGAKKKAKEETAAEPDTNTPDPIREHSISQRSYVNIANHFNELVQLVGTVPAYDPNETDLTLDALGTFVEGLDDQNQQVTDTFIQLTLARITRDRLLYAEGTGLVDLGLASKNYIKAAFLAKSPEYMQVAPLKFTRPKVEHDFSKYAPASTPA
jgi:hypothetical protein